MGRTIPGAPRKSKPHRTLVRLDRHTPRRLDFSGVEPRRSLAGADVGGSEQQHTLGGVDISEHAAWLSTRFLSVGAIVVVLEIVLGCWPIVATSLWGSRAVDTWIHFLWLVKAAILLPAVIRYHTRPYLLSAFKTQSEPPVDPTKHPMENLMDHIHSVTSVWERCAGATYSCEIATWTLVSVLVHALASTVLLLIVLVVKGEFRTTTQWALSLSFDAVGIAESILAPILVMSWAVDGPAREAKRLAVRKRINQQISQQAE